MSDPDLDAFLAHYGVKGMKWGVRKERKSGSTKAGSAKQEVSVDHAAASLHSFALKGGADAQTLDSKYGPSSTKKQPDEDDDRSFYQKHKTAINVGVGVAVTGLAIYGGYKYHENLVEEKNRKAFDALLDEKSIRSAASRSAQEDLSRHQSRLNSSQNDDIRAAAIARRGLLADYAATSDKRLLAGFDPDKLDTTPIGIAKGTVFKRVSTEQETNLKSTGFFASYLDEDVERYKAILPTFWPKWGIAKQDGFVINIKANSEVKAPSPRKAYDIYSELPGDKSFRDSVDITGSYSKMSADEFAKETFQQLTFAWNTPDHPVVKTYMEKVKSSGYNALLDVNDAGALSKSPMLLLDTKAFSIEGYDALSAQDIGKTQVKEAKRLGLV